MKQTLLALVFGLVAALPAVGQETIMRDRPRPPAAAQRDFSATTGDNVAKGDIRKIDVAQGKVTLAHGQIKNLDMPKMTTVFRVKEPAMLSEVKVGDKVRFVADKIDGKITVVAWEKMK